MRDVVVEEFPFEVDNGQNERTLVLSKPGALPTSLEDASSWKPRDTVQLTEPAGSAPLREFGFWEGRWNLAWGGWSTQGAYPSCIRSSLPSLSHLLTGTCSGQPYGWAFVDAFRNAMVVRLVTKEVKITQPNGSTVTYWPAVVEKFARNPQRPCLQEGC